MIARSMSAASNGDGLGDTSLTACKTKCEKQPVTVQSRWLTTRRTRLIWETFSINSHFRLIITIFRDVSAIQANWSQELARPADAASR